MDARIRHQREKIFAQQQEIAWLDTRRFVPHTLSIRAQLPICIFQSAGFVYRIAPEGNGQERSPDQLATQDAWQKRFLDLEKLASDLADQRVQLAEQWQRLSQLHDIWETERREIGRELEGFGATLLLDNGRLLAHREEGNRQGEQLVQQRHEELLQIRQEMIAWRARLRLRETECDGERRRLLIDMKHREKLVEQHFDVLMELRRRWTKRRSDELATWRKERQLLKAGHQENSQKRQELADLSARRSKKTSASVAEKALALEQYRCRKSWARSENAATEAAGCRTFARRWITLQCGGNSGGHQG